LLITSIKEQQQLIEQQQKQIEMISTDNTGQRLQIKELKTAIEHISKEIHDLKIIAERKAP
jgi:polyhydroxyalkanoate synthesis regulator phasin